MLDELEDTGCRFEDVQLEIKTGLHIYSDLDVKMIHTPTGLFVEGSFDKMKHLGYAFYDLQRKLAHLIIDNGFKYEKSE